MSRSHQQTVEYVYDVYRRSYRVGESDRDLLGRSRVTVVVAAGVALAAVGLLQYGYAAVFPELARTAHWSVAVGLWAFGLWAACHAFATVALAWLRRVRHIPAAVVVAVGMTLCAVALFSLSDGANMLALLFGYGVAGGLGSGAVYGSCVSAVAAWYPERPGVAAGVTGAFCCGALPLLLGVGLSGGPVTPLALAAGAVVVVGLGCAAFVVDPPRYWWPTHLDPRRWSLGSDRGSGARGERSALRAYQPAEVLRSGAAGWMYSLVACVSLMALFDLGYLAALASGTATQGTVLLLITVFAAGAGLCRPLVVWLAGRWGRMRVLPPALLLGAFTQLLLLAGDEHIGAALPVAAAGLAGTAAGTAYALLPGLVRSYFGDAAGLPNFAMLYSAKLFGALLGAALAVSSLTWRGSLGFLVVAAFALFGAWLAISLRAPERKSVLLPAKCVADEHATSGGMG